MMNALMAIRNKWNPPSSPEQQQQEKAFMIIAIWELWLTNMSEVFWKQNISIFLYTPLLISLDVSAAILEAETWL